LKKAANEKYDNIIAAAIKVIAQNGYHQAQVSKIASAANVADGTIYLYFKNKADILISVFRRRMGDFITSVQQELARLDAVEEKLARLIQMHLTWLSSDRDLAVVLQIELRQSDFHIRQEIAKIVKEYYKVIDQLIAEGIDCGVFRTELNIKVTRNAIFGTMDETATAWVMNGMKFDLPANASPIYDLFINGLSTKRNQST